MLKLATFKICDTYQNIKLFKTHDLITDGMFQLDYCVKKINRHYHINFTTFLSVTKVCFHGYGKFRLKPQFHFHLM